MFGSVRWRLTAWYAGVLALTIGAVGVAVYLSTMRALDTEIDDSLERGLATLLAAPEGTSAAALSGSPPAGAVQFSSDDDGDDDEPDDDDDDHSGRGRSRDDYDDDDLAAVLSTDVFYVLTDADGDVLANPRRIDTGDLQFDDIIDGAGTAEHWSTVDTGDEGRFRFVTVPIGAPEDRAYLHVGRSLVARDTQLRDMLVILAAVGGGGLLLAVVGGIFVSGRALVPIRRSFDQQRQFVSDASHEIRTPLAVIRANAELALRHPDQSVGDRSRELESIVNETSHLGQMVDRLLTLARADEGILHLMPEHLALDELVEGVAADFAAIGESRGIAVTSDISPVTVTADPGRVRELVAILLDNAIKHTPRGGRVVVRCRPSGHGALIEVADTGEGIPHEHVPRVFDRFYRVDKARSRDEGGAGLGLSIARWIAEAHGGHISAQSEPGQGATFTVRLPRRA